VDEEKTGGSDDPTIDGGDGDPRESGKVGTETGLLSELGGKTADATSRQEVLREVS